MRFKVAVFIMLCLVTVGCDDKTSGSDAQVSEVRLSQSQYQRLVSNLGNTYSTCLSKSFYKEAKKRMEAGNLPVFNNTHYISLCQNEKNKLETEAARGIQLLGNMSQADSKAFAGSISKEIEESTFDKLWRYSRPR